MSQVSIIDRILRRKPVPSFDQSAAIDLPDDDREPGERKEVPHAFAAIRHAMATPGLFGIGDMKKEYAAAARELMSGGPLGIINNLPVISSLGLQIVDAMVADFPGTCVDLKKTAVLSCPWSWEAASDDDAHQEHAAYLTEVFDQLDAGEQDPDGVNVGVRKKLRDIMSAVAYGYSITNVILTVIDRGEFKGKAGIADLKTKPPHWFSFDVDDFMNVKDNGIVYSGDYTKGPQKLPKDAFLVYSYHSPFCNPYGYSDMIRAYDRWNSRRWINKLWDLYLERKASGTYVATYKADDPPPPAELAAATSFISGGSAKNGLLVSDRFDITSHEAEGSADVWQPAVDSRNAEIARAILIPDKMGFSAAQDSGGAYAMSQTHFDVLLMVIYDLQSDLSALMKQLGRRLVSASFGPQDKYPNFTFAPMSNEAKVWWISTVMTAVEKGVLVADETVMAKVREILDLPEAEEPVDDPNAPPETDPNDPNAPDPEFPPEDPTQAADDPEDVDEEYSADMLVDMDALVGEVGMHDRVIVVGGPRTGKTMLSTLSAYRHARAHRHTDSLMGAMHWSAASEKVAEWFNEPGRWVVEGVATVRALRKWLMANPDKAVPATILLMDAPQVKRKKGQRIMAKGVRTIWAEILPELEKRGATIITPKRKESPK